MIAIVVVSHSRALAQAARELALSLVDPGHAPRVLLAAGHDDGFGTDAATISLTIRTADSPDGVLVLLDMGSAVLSTQLAVGFLDPTIAQRVVVSPAPLVEGLMTAVVAAASGADLDAVAAQASEALVSKGGADPIPRPAAKPVARSRTLTWRAVVDNPHGIHIRPAASIITALRELDAHVRLSNATTGVGPVDATSLARITSLEVQRGHILEARITGPEAEEARATLADLASRHFGEPIGPRPARSLPIAPALAPASTTSQPRGSGSQIAIGPIHRRTAVPNVDGYHPRSPKEELARYTRASADVEDYLEALALSRPAGSGILEAQQALVTDRELAHAVVGRITEGFGAVASVSDYLTSMARRMDGLTDPYLRERAQDVRSIRRLLLLALLGRPLADDEPDEPCIWLVDELDAATASRLDARLCLGVITTSGGRNGHGVLTAEGRGIPVLTGSTQAGSLSEGQIVAFDPLSETLWVNPSEQQRVILAERNRDRARLREAASERAHEPAVTSSGVRVLVEANLSSLADARIAAAEGAEGSGIVRTEILFAARVKAPTAEEQAEVYAQLGRTLKGGRVTIRTWDVGGDKPLSFVPVTPEANPSLGERGIRAMRRDKALFTEQLRGIALAARDTPLRVMFPMVTHASEVRWARSVLDEVVADIGAVDLPVGVMIEVPAAAIRAGSFRGLVDYVSFGTNDLAQYALASDRTNGRVPFSGEDPAVWDLIELACGQLPDVPLAVCGNLASDIRSTARLIGLGITELSVRPTLVGQVKQAVRRA